MVLWKHVFNQNRMPTLTSYLLENTVRLYCKAQLMLQQGNIATTCL